MVMPSQCNEVQLQNMPSIQYDACFLGEEKALLGYIHEVIFILFFFAATWLFKLFHYIHPFQEKLKKLMFRQVLLIQRGHVIYMGIK